MQITKSNTPSFRAYASISKEIYQIQSLAKKPNQVITGLAEDGNHPVLTFINAATKAISGKKGHDTFALKLGDEKGNPINGANFSEDTFIWLEKLSQNNSSNGTGFSLKSITNNLKDNLTSLVNKINN